MKIRKATQFDTPQLEELFLVTRRQAFTWENPNKFQLGDFAKATSGETVFVAVDDNERIVGFASIWEDENPKFIHHLFVAPEFQRKRIGKQLIRNLITLLPPPYRLKCLVKNRIATAFYLGNHWVELDRGISEEGEYRLLELPAFTQRGKRLKSNKFKLIRTHTG